VGGVSILIDAGPDFRAQALRENIEHIDAVLFTHHHFDHVVGLDDLRPYLFYNRTPIPCYAPPETERVVRKMFSYIFDDGSYPGVANLTLSALDGDPFDVASRETSAAARVVPIPAWHGDTPVYGYRFGNVAYLTDTNRIPDSSLALLEGVEILILDALRRKPHRTHFSFDEAIEVSRHVKARETWFVHMTHTVGHAEEDDAMPEGVRLAYDGLVLEA
jgi:phosphoribosyl 1,2-cyclic phosphate phosphodiesterase